MATTKLVIRKDKANSKGECVILVLYTHDQKSIKISTGEKIHPDNWDPETERVRKKYRGFTSLNAAIEAKENQIKELANIAKSLNIEPTVEYIREKVDSQKPNLPQASINFYSLYEKWIKDNTGRKVKIVLSHQLSTLKYIREFEQVKNHKVTIDRIDMSFYNKFTTWLMVEKELAPGTVGKHIKHIKAFLNHLTELGINSNMTYKSKSFKKLTTKTDIIYLTRSELDQLFNFDLSNNPRLDRVRDIFIFECATGLRYSDIENFKPENVKGDYIKFTTIKTREKLDIPINSYAKAILKKYNGELPKTISNQKMNDALKELGKHCGIDTPEQIVKYVGSVRKQETKPKYELITTHCARRTFITQSLERGLRPEVIMRITGHKDLTTMMRYVKITQDVVKSEMQRAWDDAPDINK